MQGGWQRGLEPSLHDRPSQEIWPSETEYRFPSKQIWRRIQTWKDDEVLLGLSFPASKHQEKVFWFSSNQPSLYLSYFSTYRGIKNSLPYPKHMLRAHYISTSLATVIWEWSLNQFSTSRFVSLFVNREPQQIFMGENTEYRANLVKARVNFPVTLLHIYWVCQYKLFLISEGWEGFTEPSKPSLEYHWSDNQ